MLAAQQFRQELHPQRRQHPQPPVSDQRARDCSEKPLPLRNTRERDQFLQLVQHQQNPPEPATTNRTRHDLTGPITGATQSLQQRRPVTASVISEHAN